MSTTKATIAFDKMTIKRSDDGPLTGVTVSRCGICQAIVLDEESDRQQHADWHGTLTSAVRSAHLGMPYMGQARVL